MTDAYKIGITVALSNLVSAELLKIVGQFGSADKAALGFAGNLGLVAGAVTVVVAGLSAGVKEASKFETELAKFRMYGLGDKINEDAKEFAMHMKVAGLNFTDAMHFMNEAQGVFRQSGRNDASALDAAKIAAPVLAKIAFIDKALYGKEDASAHSPESLAMLRWIDMTGGANDPTGKRFNELADVGFRLKTTSGGQIDWEQLRQFRARAKTAGFGFSDEMYGMAEPIIGELKGSTAGNSLSTAYNRAHAIIKVPSQGVGEYLKFGLWDKSKVDLNSLGGIKKLHGDPLIDAEGYDTNFIKWYFDHVIPVYDKLKLTANQRIRENALLFGSTGGNAFSLVDRQRDLITASNLAFGKAHHIDQGYEDAMDTPAGRVTKLSGEWDKTMTHLGEEVLPITNTGLAGLTKILEGLNAFFGWKNAPSDSPAINAIKGAIFGYGSKIGEDQSTSSTASAVVPPSKPDTKYLGTTVVQVDKREIGRASTEYTLQEFSYSPAGGSATDYRQTLQPVNY